MEKAKQTHKQMKSSEVTGPDCKCPRPGKAGTRVGCGSGAGFKVKEAEGKDESGVRKDESGLFFCLIIYEFNKHRTSLMYKTLFLVLGTSCEQN